jgi:hypothetical protein
MANKKITELTEETSPQGADLLALVDDVSGTPTTKKVTVSNLMTQAPVQTADISGLATQVSLGNHEALTSAVHGISAFGATLVDDADASAARTTLGLGTAATSASTDFSSAFYSTVSQTTTSRTLSDSDNGKVIVCTNASTITVTIPSTLTAGFSCKLVQGGAGIVGVSAGSGTTLSLIGGKAFTSGQYQVVDLINYATNAYVLDSNNLQVDPAGWSGNGHSLSFDGVSDYCSFTQTTFSASSGLTLSAWVNFSSLPSDQEPIIGEDGNAGYWSFNPSNKYFYFKNSAGTQYFAGPWSGTPAINTWYHFMVIDSGAGTSGSAKAYIDGNLVGNFNGTGFASVALDSIARAGGRYFPGLIDEVAIWESDQTANISTIYNSGSADDLTSLSPLHWWRMGDFEGGATATVKDQGGAGTTLDLSINGATASTDAP